MTYLTRKEAAAEAVVSTNTIKDWSDKGYFESVKDDKGRVKIVAESFRTYLSSRNRSNKASVNPDKEETPTRPRPIIYLTINYFSL